MDRSTEVPFLTHSVEFKYLQQVDYVGDPTPHAIGSIGSKGACLRKREIVTLRRLLFSFLRFNAHRYRSARWTDRRR